jgi:hypothetical protein
MLGNVCFRPIADIREIIEHPPMRNDIALAAIGIVLAGCSTNNRPIDRRKADSIANDSYRAFVKEEPARARMLGRPVVEEQADGWSYHWKCKSSVDSSLGVFVERSGKADYDESPYCDSQFPASGKAKR